MSKGQIPWNKGLTKETSEGVRKISESKKGDKNPMKDPEVVKKMQSHPNIIKGYQDGGYFGKLWREDEDFRLRRSKHMQENNPMFDFECSKRAHQKTRKDGWGEEKICIFCGVGFTPFDINHHYQHFRKFCSQRCATKYMNLYIMNGTSKLEREFGKTLKTQNVEAEEQKVILKLVRADFFIKPNICIFVDGCYWHGCPIHHPERKRKYENDRYVDRFLRKNNFVVIRVWEHEIKENVNACIKQIKELITF